MGRLLHNFSLSGVNLRSTLALKGVWLHHT